MNQKKFFASLSLLLLFHFISNNSTSKTSFLEAVDKNLIDDESFISRNLSNDGKQGTQDGGIKFIDIHKVFLNLWWCIGADIATIAARYFRSKFYYIQFHRALFSITMVVTLVFSFIMIFQSTVREKLSKDNINYNWHFYLGVALMPIAVIKMITGFACYQQLVRRNPTSKYYNYLLNFHKIGGYIAIILGKAIAVIGSCIHTPEYISYIIIYGLILFFYIIFEIHCRAQNEKWVKMLGLLWNWIAYKLCCTQPIMKRHPEYNKIIEELQNNQALDLVDKYPKLTFALYRDYLVDLTGIIHPAGTFMNYDVKGREISRFINGSYDLETFQWKSIHQHTKFAVQQLNRHTVGKIDTSAISLVKKNQLSAVTSEVRYLNSEKYGVWGDDSSFWKLVKKTEILPNIIQVEFSSNQHTVLNFLPGLEWLGRHMAITPAKNPYKERIYTTVIFSTENNTKVRNQLIEMFEKKMNNEENINTNFHIEEISQTYPMIIKKYPGKYKPLSVFIIDSKETEYILTGPFGQGFGFNNQSNKTYYFLLGGTTMPILDPADIILKKCIYTVILQKFGKEEAEKFNPYKYNFEKMMGQGFKIVVILTLKSIDQFIGREIFAKLLEICSKYEIGIFDMIVRFTKLMLQFFIKIVFLSLTEEEQKNSPYAKNMKLRKNRFDKQFLLENIKLDKNFGKVFICGPHNFILDSYAAIKNEVGENNIIIV